MNLLCQKLMIGSWSLYLLLLVLSVFIPNTKDCLAWGHPAKLNSSTPRFTLSQPVKPRKENKFFLFIIPIYKFKSSFLLFCFIFAYLFVSYALEGIVYFWRSKNKTKQKRPVFIHCLNLDMWRQKDDGLVQLPYLYLILKTSICIQSHFLLIK